MTPCRLTKGGTICGTGVECLGVAFCMQIPPYEREIFVITMIKTKINDHCDKVAAEQSGGAAA